MTLILECLACHAEYDADLWSTCPSCGSTEAVDVYDPDFDEGYVREGA